MTRPVLLAASTVMAHVPGLVRIGSKPGREIARDSGLVERLIANSRGFDDAVGYAPNQAFIGAIHPRAMGPRPHFNRVVEGGRRFGPDGEIMPEREFLGLMALADQFKVLQLAPELAQTAAAALARHPLSESFDARGLEAASGDPAASLARGALGLYLGSGEFAAALAAGHNEDSNLIAEVIAENLACKASGALALAHLLRLNQIEPASIEYVIGCSEEAVGDRYQRGGGNMGKAIAEMSGCTEASGADVKNFCAAPVPAMVIAASLVAAGVFRRVAVVGGGSLPKLGMKFEGHLKNSMPVLEDTLGAVAAVIGEDDGQSPVVRLDPIGRHKVSSGSSAEAIMDALVTTPLDRMSLKITDIDEYATELHNPELTEPQGSGNVPERNYRMLAAMGVRRGLFGREAMGPFVTRHGMPGFAPTQGHVASAFCYLGHARRALTSGGDTRRIMMMAKGSLFLGMMTGQSDGMSFILERNGG
ncbi:MAG TPA: glycine/sarcosine/betaine reductase complex component C subunit beta [Candidatus Binataceae bacterium]|nr:glycine/sarcosine/betaine reductase complex component C subunit beta [Candidatus Binataceae bacterium]